MRSVADVLRAEERRALAALQPAERVRLALRLGARDLESFRLAHDPTARAPPRPTASCDGAASRGAALRAVLQELIG